MTREKPRHDSKDVERWNREAEEKRLALFDQRKPLKDQGKPILVRDPVAKAIKAAISGDDD